MLPKPVAWQAFARFDAVDRKSQSLQREEYPSTDDPTAHAERIVV